MAGGSRHSLGICIFITFNISFVKLLLWKGDPKDTYTICMRTKEEIEFDILFAERELDSLRNDVAGKEKLLNHVKKELSEVETKLKNLILEKDA